jgi:hypothetical protein
MSRSLASCVTWACGTASVVRCHHECGDVLAGPQHRTGCWLPQVRSAYVDTLSRVLSSHFRAYLQALDGLKVGFYLLSHTLVLSCKDHPK